MKTIHGEVERLKKMLADNPRSRQFARLAEYLLLLNRIPEAIDVCKNGLEHHPNYANAHFVLGQCYFQTKDFDAAESEFNKVLLYDPEHIQAHHFQAKIMDERGWSNAYFLWLKRSLAIDPMDTLAQSLMEEHSQKEMKLEPEVGEVGTSVMAEEEVPEEEEEAEPIAEEVEELQQQKAATGPETTVVEEEIREELVSEEEDEDKRFEYIIDDIFKDEVSSESPTEPIEEELASYEAAEEFVEEMEKGEAAAEQSPEEGEIVEKIRDRMEQFEAEESIAEELVPEVEEGLQEERPEAGTAEGPKEDTYPTTEVEPEEIPITELETAAEVIPSEEEGEEKKLEATLEEEVKGSGEKAVTEKERSGEDVTPPTAEEESEKEVTPLERERAARKVFGDEDEITPPIDITEELEPPEEETMVKEEEEQEPKVDKEEPPSPRKEPIVTSTLGEIYAAQGHFNKAIGVYEILLKKNPDSEFYKEKIEELKRKLEESKHKDETEYA